MAEIPANPRNIPRYARNPEAADVSFEQFVAIMDRQRRNYELMEGSEEQEDASASGRVSVGAGVTATITIEPTAGNMFLVESVSANPFRQDTEFELSADDVSTQSNVLPFGVPMNVTQKVELKITNNGSSGRDYTYNTDAREVSR